MTKTDPVRPLFPVRSNYSNMTYTRETLIEVLLDFHADRLAKLSDKGLIREAFVEYLILDDPDADQECQGCGERCHTDELEDIADYGQRVTPGDLAPSGECPECGALCFPVQGVAEEVAHA